jgi:hypothetical protein
MASHQPRPLAGGLLKYVFDIRRYKQQVIESIHRISIHEARKRVNYQGVVAENGLPFGSPLSRQRLGRAA